MDNEKIAEALLDAATYGRTEMTMILESEYRALVAAKAELIEALKIVVNTLEAHCRIYDTDGGVHYKGHGTAGTLIFAEKALAKYSPNPETT